MTTISNANNRILNIGQQTQPIDMNPAFSHHAISVEGGTGTVTLKTKPHGMTIFRAFDDNVIAENGNGVFVLGSTDELELTTENAVAYTLSVSSF